MTMDSLGATLSVFILRAGAVGAGALLAFRMFAYLEVFARVAKTADTRAARIVFSVIVGSAGGGIFLVVHSLSNIAWAGLAVYVLDYLAFTAYIVWFARHYVAAYFSIFSEQWRALPARFKKPGLTRTTGDNRE